MSNSWNNQHFQPQQPTNQIRFFDPTQFQTPTASIASPATLKQNQHQNVTAGQNNSHAGNAQQTYQQPQYQGNAWDGAASNSVGGGTMQDAHTSSWSNWGSWDWNQDQSGAVNDQQQQQQHHHQQYQPHPQQPHFQQQQQQPLQQSPPTSQALQPTQYQQQQPPTSQSASEGGGDFYTGSGNHPQYNASWDPSVGHYAQPGHQNFTAASNAPGQDMQYDQSQSASYFGGDPNAYGDQNQFFDHQPQTQHHQYADDTATQGNEGAVANTPQPTEHPQYTNTQQQPQYVNSSIGLDQGQSQVLYDQPSGLPANEYNPLSSFSDNGPWLEGSNQQSPPHYHHQQQQQQQQHDGMAGHNFDGTEEGAQGGEDNNTDNAGDDNLSRGTPLHHSLEPNLVASNASPNLQQQQQQQQHPDGFQSIPAIATTAAPVSPSHPPHHHHHSSHQPENVSADASLHEYHDNDSDGGTVAGFFGRGDDDGDVSSDAQRISNRSAAHLNSTPNTSGVADSSASAFSTNNGGQDNSGMFLNVSASAAGKSFARENSEISNASLSTFNMSVDDAGKEHLIELQALVQRMESVEIATRQAGEQEGENQREDLVAANPSSSSSLELDQQPHKRGDFTGFGNDSLLHSNTPPQPPPTLSLDTNPVADRPSSPDGGNAASSESGGSGASGTSSGLTDWEIVPSQSQMTHSRNSSLDNNVTTFTDKPDGSINESVRDGSSSNNKDGGMDDNHHQSQSLTSLSSPQQQQQQSFNPNTTKDSHNGASGISGNNNFQNMPFSIPPFSQQSGNVPSDNQSLSSPPMGALAPPPSATSQQQSPEGPLSFQPSKITKLASSTSSGSNIPPPPPPQTSSTTSTNAAAYFNPPPPIPNSNPSSISPEKSPESASQSQQQKAKLPSIPQPPLPPYTGRPKLTSDDGARPVTTEKKTDADERTTVPSSTSSNSYSSEQKFRKPREPGVRRGGDNQEDKAKVPVSSSSSSSSSQRRHQSAFHPIHRPRMTTVSPATTLWDTDSGSSSNILLAPAMPLIIPALNPYSSSAAATATTDTAAVVSTSTAASNDVSNSSMSTSSASASAATRVRGSSREPEEQTPRSRHSDRKADRERGKEERQRDREDTNRSFDSLDELDSGPDYRTPRDRPYKSDRPDSRSDRRYEYDYPSARGDQPQSRSGDRPMSRSGDRPMSRSETGGGYRDDPQYKRHKGGYYADSYYDEHYDRPRSRHDEAVKNSSRPSSRSGGQEADRPGSRAGDYDRERDYGYRDRNRGYYDGYGRNDYYNDDRDRYYRYYRDRDARYSRGYYEEYYGKNAEQYLQQHQQQQQQQLRQSRPDSRSHESHGAGSRNHSRSHESDGAGSRNHSRSRSQSHSRGNTPGPDQQSDYYRSSRPDSRQQDYARDYYRGYGYDYAGYYDGYGYDQYAGYGYAGYADSVNQGYDKGRMTPPKYAYPHVRACFGPNGQLIKVLPNRPADGQPALVELVEVQTVLETCQEAEDLKLFPGPLTREGTHKKDVLLFCQRKAIECMEDVDMVDRESAQLIWKLLELLIKQNGSVVGTDLSDLLLDGHEPGATQYSTAGRRASSRQSTDGLEMMTEDSLEGDGSSRNSPTLALTAGGVRTSMDRTVITPNHQREDYIARFRHLLLYGRKKDAIECAMKYNLWGHALFLASKMDTRTHASVMIRFANSAMRMNDPLQTLYQLMSGRQPASVTCVVDERWGDWRPHLAMILSNQTSRPELDRKSITTLGDTLAAKGCLHASHFCYLMAQVPFGTYDKKTSKIVLVGSNHYLPLKEFASMEAIQCTEVYEYSQTLSNAASCLPHFQLYKYLYACRLVDFGLVTEAFMYCEVMASAICRYPSYFQPSFVHLVFELASKLKYSDPQRQNSHVDEHVDPVWIDQLQGLMPQYADGTIQPVSGTITPADLRSSAADASSGANGSVDSTLYQQQQQQYQQTQQPEQAQQQQQQQQQPYVADASTGYYQGAGGGEVPAQGSSSAGFDTQGIYQYSQQQQQQPGQTDYSAGQYYQQEASATDQQQQQYPGYDQTDATATSAAPQQQQNQQQQQHYHQDYSAAAADGSVAPQQTGYDQQAQQQQHDYNQWQQQQQQQYNAYYGYNNYYNGYTVVDGHQHPQQQPQTHQADAQPSHSLSSSSSSSTASTSVLPPSSFMAAAPPQAESNHTTRSSHDSHDPDPHHHHHHHHHHAVPSYHHNHHHDHQQQQQQPVAGDDTDNQVDLTSSQASSNLSGAAGFGGQTGSGSMAMPPRPSISTNETEDDDDDDDNDDDDDDNEQGGPVTGFDYFGNASQRVVVPPSRLRSPSESSTTGGGGRRRRTTSGSSSGSVKASPHKPAPPSSQRQLSSGPGGDGKDGSAGGGWFGGLFSKFGRKGKNEMILPDDKDPAIVWDPQRKKWVNADGTEEAVTVAAPPPKDADLMGGKSSASAAAPPPSISGASTSMPPPPSMGPPGTNKFSLKAKGGRNQYVDVNNPKPVSAPTGLFSMTPPLGNGATSGAVPQVFLPGSTPGTTKDTNSSSSSNNANNLLLPPTMGDDLSRSSSSSSVNQEVQRLMAGQTAQDTTNTSTSAQQQQAPPPPPASSSSSSTTTATNAMPMLFNPATLNAGGSNAGGSSAAGPGLKYGQRRAYPKK